MLLIDIDKNINKLILTTDDPTIHFFMESKKTQYQYIPWKKHWGYVDKKVKIYDSGRQVKGKGLLRYELGLGWASYLIGIFKDKMSAENYEYIIKNVILADNYRTIPFTELRDYQNDDVLFLLKYRLGLMQVNTGYGLEQ